MNYHQIWNTFSYALNGFVFVVLGFMIPTVVIDIFQTEPDNFSFFNIDHYINRYCNLCMSICLGLFLVQRLLFPEKYTILSRRGT